MGGKPWHGVLGLGEKTVEPSAWRAPGTTAKRSAWWPCLHSIRVPTPVENECPTGDQRQPQADGVSCQIHLRLHVVVIRSGAGDARTGYPVVRSWRGPATLAVADWRSCQPYGCQERVRPQPHADEKTGCAGGTTLSDSDRWQRLPSSLSPGIWCLRLVLGGTLANAWVSVSHVAARTG